MQDPRILESATFNQKVCTYWLLSGGFILLVCVVTIPLLVPWFIFGSLVTRRYLDHVACSLTERTLIVKKGWINRIEKTIPLEKITDLALVQGPIMRVMGLHGLSVETAGSTGGTSSGALVTLVGIVDVQAFRDSVLSQRDRLMGTAESARTPEDAGPDGEDRVLEDIRDMVRRIERHLADR